MSSFQSSKYRVFLHMSVALNSFLRTRYVDPMFCSVENARGCTTLVVHVTCHISDVSYTLKSNGLQESLNVPLILFNRRYSIVCKKKKLIW